MINFLKKNINRLNRENIPHFLRILNQIINQYIDTYTSYLLATWWRVDVNKDCTFVGKIYFRRTPYSKISIGENCRFLSTFSSNLHGLNRPCMISTVNGNARIKIGNNVGMSGTIVVSAKSVTIGDRVFCGANTTITDTDSHSLDFKDRTPKYFGKPFNNWIEPVNASPIIIENDCFLGMNVTVLKGVTIGRGTVIGAGNPNTVLQQASQQKLSDT